MRKRVEKESRKRESKKRVEKESRKRESKKRVEKESRKSKREKEKIMETSKSFPSPGDGLTEKEFLSLGRARRTSLKTFFRELFSFWLEQ